VKKILIIPIVIWVIISFTAITSGKTGTSVQPGTYPPVHGNNFFDPAHFYTGEFKETPGFSHIYGAVVPHHLLADRLIAEVFFCLARQKPSTIVLVGPNHENLGERLSTSIQGWQTPFGVVDADTDLIAALEQVSGVKQDDAVCEHEHSLGNIMPFIKYYLPEAKVVPIALHHDVSPRETADLARQLVQTMRKDAVIIASVDFSHYLTAEEAEQKDRETLQALKRNNMGQIFSMDNDHLDSPPSLGVLFSAMENYGLGSFSLLRHTNSGVLLNNKVMETTSYFTLIFDKN